MQFTDITERKYELFEHDCSNCVFVATYVYHDLNFFGRFDLYYCLRKTHSSVCVELVTRYGGAGEYFCISFFDNELKTALEYLNKNWITHELYWHRLAIFSLERFFVDNPSYK